MMPPVDLHPPSVPVRSQETFSFQRSESSSSCVQIDLALGMNPLSPTSMQISDSSAPAPSRKSQLANTCIGPRFLHPTTIARAAIETTATDERTRPNDMRSLLLREEARETITIDCTC